MGLSNHLTDVSSESIPILLLISAVRGVCYIRCILFSLVRSLIAVADSPPSDDGHPSSSPSAAAVGSGLAGLAGLAVLADQLASTSAFVAGPAAGGGCVFCLGGMGEGERLRRLPCCHVFHSECLDGWIFERMCVTCPLCRAPLEAAVAAEERRADAERRIGAELVALLSPC